jgi:hypothetical protein
MSLQHSPILIAIYDMVIWCVIYTIIDYYLNILISFGQHIY